MESHWKKWVTKDRPSLEPGQLHVPASMSSQSANNAFPIMRGCYIQTLKDKINLLSIKLLFSEYFDHINKKVAKTEIGTKK